MKDPRGVIWDFDQTMFNTTPIRHEVLGVVLPKYGVKPPTAEQVRHFPGKTLQDMLRQHSNNHPDLDKIVVDFKREQERHYLNPVFMPGVLDTVFELAKQPKPVRQAIVTNRGNLGRGAAGINAIIAASPAANIFEAIVSVDDITKPKPDPEGLTMALGKIGVEAENAVAIGDDVIDIVAAHSIGMRAVAVWVDGSEPNAFRNIVAYHPFAIVHRPEELRPAVFSALEINP